MTTKGPPATRSSESPLDPGAQNLCRALLSALRELCDADVAALDRPGSSPQDRGARRVLATRPGLELPAIEIETRITAADRVIESPSDDRLLRRSPSMRITVLGAASVDGEPPVGPDAAKDHLAALDSLLDLIGASLDGGPDERPSAPQLLSELARQAVRIEARVEFEHLALDRLRVFLGARTVALVCLRGSVPRVLRLAGAPLQAGQLHRASLDRIGATATVKIPAGSAGKCGGAVAPPVLGAMASRGCCTGALCSAGDPIGCDGSVGMLWCVPNEGRSFGGSDLETVRGVAHLIGLVTQREAAQERLRQESQLAQTTLASIADAVLRLDAKGRIEFANEAAQRLTGEPSFRLAGMNLADLPLFVGYGGALVHDPMGIVRELTCGSGDRGTFVLRGADGELNELDVQVSPIRNAQGETDCTVITLSDVTESRRMARELRHRATHDPLTGLVNRPEFERRVSQATRDLAVDEQHVVCFLDLDRFKVVNDTAGHAAGDQMIQQLAGILRNSIRRGDVIGRLGGDEFGILLRDCDVLEAKSVARDLLDAVENYRFRFDGKTYEVGVSIGLVGIDGPEWSVEEILGAADRACFEAKDAGRHRLAVADSVRSPDSPPSGDIQWLPRIQEALLENRFVLFGQPIHRIEEHGTRATAFEVLIRKRSRDGELIPPGAFLPAAERYHFATRIDRWTLCETLRLLSVRSREFASAEFCTINLSGQSIGDLEFLEFALHEVRNSGVPPEQIGFEITETAAIANLSVARDFMEALGGLGCQFLLDDFGSGLSSFAYLKDLPVDIIKIDGRFVRDMTEEPVDFAMVRSIHEIAALTNKRTVAEHAEGEATIDLLRALGVQYAQGYELGQPVPLADLLACWSS